MTHSVWKMQSKDKFLLLLIFLILLLLFLMNPETIPAGGGFGYDGVIYGKMVSDIDTMISGGELSEYYAQRTLPSLIVRTALNTLNIPIETESIINGFRVFNCTLMMISVLFWVAISQRIHLTSEGFWVGIIGLILIYPNAKQIFYYPVLTDTFAFTIGLAMIWAHLSSRTLLLAVIAVVGSFAWQMSAFIGMALVASSLIELEPLQKPEPDQRGNRIILAIISLAALLSLTISILYIFDFRALQQYFPFDPSIRILTNIPTLAISACFITYLMINVIYMRWHISFEISRVASVIISLCAIALIPSYIIKLIANPEIPPPGISGYTEILKALLVLRVREGLIFLPLVSHTVFYGPVFLLLLVLWRKSSSTTRELGVGFVFTISLFIFLSVFSESRFTFMLWPFAVTVVCKVVSDHQLPQPTLYLVILSAIGLSKAWLVINQGTWPTPDYEAIYEWPKSIYFSSNGPWMSVNNYALQGAISLIIFILLYVNLRTTLKKI